MRKHFTPIEWAYLAITACGCTIAAVFPPVSGGGPIDQVLRTFYYALLAASGGAVLFETRSTSPKAYFAALTVHGICAFALAPIVAGHLGLQSALFGTFVVGICLCNPFPASVLLSVLVNVILLVIQGFVLSARGLPAHSVVEMELEYTLIAVALTGLATRMVLYREQLISYQNENTRLDGLVDRLTRANLNYQEYAKVVREASIESERKRITRDIHDIVGYTLTNNITMMEAITDMININPLGVSHLVKRARDNAQEGLSRVRDALHLLRGQVIDYPTGLHAVERLLRQFEQATGVRVEFAYSEVAWDFQQELDVALYHLVQESLVNAFRHGKASLIRLFLAMREDTLELKISDNGVGATDFKEGIGLTGMRERLARLGGTLSAGPAAGGFEVIATVRMDNR